MDNNNLSGMEVKINKIKTKNKENKQKNIIDVLDKQKKKEDLSKFDPITGEKIAFDNNPQTQKPKTTSITQGFQGIKRINQNDYKKLMQRKLLALDEIKAEARKGKTDPVNKWDAIKSGTLGTTAGFLVGNLLDTTARRKGLLSLGMGLGVAALDTKKQMADYNAQMGARETLLGINTPRKKAYLNNVKNKYNI